MAVVKMEKIVEAIKIVAKLTAANKKDVAVKHNNARPVAKKGTVVLHKDVARKVFVRQMMKNAVSKFVANKHNAANELQFLLLLFS